MIGVWPAYPQRIASVLRKCIYRLPFRDLLLGRHVDNSTSSAIMLIFRKAAAYMGTLPRDSGTLDMHSSYADIH